MEKICKEQPVGGLIWLAGCWPTTAETLDAEGWSRVQLPPPPPI